VIAIFGSGSQDEREFSDGSRGEWEVSVLVQTRILTTYTTCQLDPTLAEFLSACIGVIYVVNLFQVANLNYTDQSKQQGT